MMRNGWGVLAAMLMLSACGSNGGGASTGTGVATDWNAADACALVDKGAIAAAAGAGVETAELSPVTRLEEMGTVFSTCSWSLADGAAVGMLAKANRDEADTDRAVAEMRAGAEGIVKPYVDVPGGPGRSTQWEANLRSLQVALDGHRLVILNYLPPMGRRAAPKDAQAVLLEIARTLK